MTTTVTIGKATATVTVTPVTATYDGQAHPAVGTVAGVNGETLGTATVTYSGGTTPVHAGTYTATATFAGNQDYQPASATATVVIGKAAATISVNSVSATFDGQTHAATATVTGVNGEALGAAITYSGGTTPVHAGTYTVTATFAGTADYDAATATGTVVIGKATPTIALNPISTTFDGQSHPVTVVVTGVGGTSLGAATITYSGGVTPTHAGTYTATATFAATADYIGATATATVTIAKATATVSVSSVTTTYDGQAHGTTGHAYGVGGEDLGLATVTYGGPTPVHAGTYTASAAFAGSGDYNPASATATVAINKAGLAVTANNKSKVYGAALPPLTLSYAGFVNGETTANLSALPSLSTTATAGSHVAGNPYAITAAGAAAADYAITYTAGTLTVTPAALTVRANDVLSVAGSIPALTASYAGFVNGDTVFSLTAPATVTTPATPSSLPGQYPLTPGGVVDPDYAVAYVAGTLTLIQGTTTPTVTTPAGPAYFGQAQGFTATVANAYLTPTGLVNFFDTTTGVDLGSVPLSANGTATLSTALLPPGNNVITATYLGTSTFTSSSNAVGTSVLPSFYIMNPTAAGALTMTGNATITIAGLVDVASSSASAVSVAGSGKATVGKLQVVGKLPAASTAKFNVTPLTGVSSFSDPLAGLPVPSAATYGLTNRGSVSVTGSTALTISPGVYSQISVSGNGKLTMNPGIYVVAGGGFLVSGNGSATGTGVMIYNAGSNYTGTGSTFGAFNLSGNGTVSLKPMTTGVYAGVLLFQARDNATGVSLSGNAMTLPGGVLYAVSAALSLSGNGRFDGAVDVATVNVSGNAVLNQVSNSGGKAFTPAAVRDAYGINDLAFDGTGQTIAIVTAYHNPNIFEAVDVYDRRFGLAASGQSLHNLYGPAAGFLSVVGPNGDGRVPDVDPSGVGTDNWEKEAALDVEWVHAIAPGAKIVLVEAAGESLAELMAAVKTASSLPGVSVVSMSWGFHEGQDVLAQDEALYDGYLNVPGVTFVASTGDRGLDNPEYPAFSPNVVAVGGTSLRVNADGSYAGEAGWGTGGAGQGGTVGSGGGVSRYELVPGYQTNVQSTGRRTTPDVSAVGDPETGVWIADPYNSGSTDPWTTVGGTSLSAPIWGALMALVNQGRARAGKPAMNSAEALQALYNVSPSDFHDVTTGGSGFAATPGYDLATGLGTPVANRLVPALVRYDGEVTTSRDITVTPDTFPSTATAGVHSTNGWAESGPTLDQDVPPAEELPFIDLSSVLLGTPVGGPNIGANNFVGRPNLTSPLRAKEEYRDPSLDVMPKTTAVEEHTAASRQQSASDGITPDSAEGEADAHFSLLPDLTTGIFVG